MELFLAFIVALAVTAAAVPLLARWAPAIGLNDAPGPRKVHSSPIPRVGGIGMALGSLVPMLFLLPASGRQLEGLIAGLLMLLVFGVWDDRRTLGYRTKLAGQMIAVIALMVIGDVRIDSFTFESRIALPGIVSWPLTFIFLIGVTNAVNLSDGLDGLAGGIALLCCTALALLGAVGGNLLVTSVALIQCGAILGFLRFNTHPARVFMGDCGSQMLGFNMGALAILATQGDSTTISAALPLLLIGVPIFDTLNVIWRRIREGRSPFSSDRSHLHHRLLALGFTHGDAVILICLTQVLLFLLAYFLRFVSDVTIFMAFCASAIAALGTLAWAARTGWRAHTLMGTPRLPATITRGIRRFIPLKQLPVWMLYVSALSLLVYGTAVLAATREVSLDIGLLSLALLLGLIGLVLAGAERSLGWFERAAAYVSVVLVVYLDQTGTAAHALMPQFTWTLLAVTGVATLLRYKAPGGRLEVTALDVLVLFIAIVVPNLPGATALPEELAAGIAKGVILLYAVDAWLAGDRARAVPRAVIACALVVISARALMPALL